MFEIAFEKSFIRAARKRIKNDYAFEKKLKDKLLLFKENPFHPILKTHKLSGEPAGLYSFSIDFDCRIIFYFFLC
jgi:mRNA-degrading endonuclease YafQ of YafQ-DinJ toxin-antitoxin module